MDGTSGAHYERIMKPGIGTDESRKITEVMLNIESRLVIDSVSFEHIPQSNRGQFFIYMRGYNQYSYEAIKNKKSK
jgi:hypothetical protein